MKNESLLSPPRDKGGSVASSRLDYQKDWSLCRLLESHESGEDYVFIFEHDDDLMILLAKDGKEQISFYQVKTKELGDWTLTDVLKRNKSKTGASLSILGRLYANKIKYAESVGSLNLISNARYKVPLSSGKTSEKKKDFCVSECATEEIKKIVSKLTEEHSLSVAPDTGIIFLKVTDLSLSDSKIHTTGKITDFLSRVIPDSGSNAKVAYQSLFEEIRRRCNYADECKTIDDLKKHKSITKKDFLQMLDVISRPSSAKRLDEIWPITQQRLNQEGMDPKTIVDIKIQWMRFGISSVDYSDEIHNNFLQTVTELVRSSLSINPRITSLVVFIENLLSQYKAGAFYKSCPEVYNDSYIMASILSIYYDEPKLPQVDKEFNEEAA